MANFLVNSRLCRDKAGGYHNSRFATRFKRENNVLQKKLVDLTAKNGKEAIEAIETRDYDIVLMDIEMPVMNGLETTQYIRGEMPFPKNRTVIVALTAHDPEMFFEDFKDVGFDSLLTKPYNLKNLSALIKEQKS